VNDHRQMTARYITTVEDFRTQEEPRPVQLPWPMTAEELSLRFIDRRCRLTYLTVAGLGAIAILALAALIWLGPTPWPLLLCALAAGAVLAAASARFKRGQPADVLARKNHVAQHGSLAAYRFHAGGTVDTPAGEVQLLRD
jgi:hypothetical protein